MLVCTTCEKEYYIYHKSGNGYGTCDKCDTQGWVTNIMHYKKIEPQEPQHLKEDDENE